jgi:hypothetical protein
MADWMDGRHVADTVSIGIRSVVMSKLIREVLMGIQEGRRLYAAGSLADMVRDALLEEYSTVKVESDVQAAEAVSNGEYDPGDWIVMSFNEIELHNASLMEPIRKTVTQYKELKTPVYYYTDKVLDRESIPDSMHDHVKWTGEQKVTLDGVPLLMGTDQLKAVVGVV